MIYEVRTYRVPPRTQPAFVKTFGEAYEHRKKVSELAAFFFTEIGPLNEVIHVWPYENLAERDAMRTKGSQDGTWPPKFADPPQHMQSEIFTPFPFTPTMPAGKMGPVFEWRSYMIKPGGMKNVAEAWGAGLEPRTKMSPLVMAMHTEVGDLNKFVHIWSYENLEHRREVRAEAAEKGIWPPKGTGDVLITQENKICYAAPFSPLQ